MHHLSPQLNGFMAKWLLQAITCPPLLSLSLPPSLPFHPDQSFTSCCHLCAGGLQSEEERAAAEAKAEEAEEHARKKRFCEQCCNEPKIGYLCNVQCGGDIHGCAEDPDGLDDDDDDDLDDILAMFDE